MSETEIIRSLAYYEMTRPRDLMNIDSIIKNGVYYKEFMDSQRLFIDEENTINNEHTVYFRRPNSLLHKNYVGALWYKFKKIDNYSGLGLTLTLKNCFYNSVLFDMKKIKKSWDILKKWLHRYLFKTMKIKWSGNYFLVMEIGKDRNIHLHIILYHVDYIKFKDIKNKWHSITKDSYILWLSKPGNGSRAKDYVSKYFNPEHFYKQYQKKKVNLFLLWASGCRTWSCGKGVFNWLEPIQEREFKKFEKEMKKEYTKSDIYISWDCDLEGKYIIVDSIKKQIEKDNELWYKKAIDKWKGG